MTTTYSPISRRPIAARFRATARPAARWCIRHHVHPDLVSYASIVAAALAAIGFWLGGRWHWLLLVAPLFAYVRLWLNMLDGMVALEARVASPRGEILNDLPDRISDIIIFAGVAHSGLCNPFIAYWAAILAVLTAYVGVFGQAVGAGRQFGGVMSKPWRMVALHFGAWIALAMIWAGAGAWRLFGLTVLDITCLVIIIGCIQTIAVRLRRIMIVLRESRG